MAKEKALPAGGFFHELVHVGVYKGSQGKVTRQVTFAAIAVAVTIGSWRLYDSGISTSWLDIMTGSYRGVGRIFFPAFILILGNWMAYRIVNLPSFADFLIAVQAEMNKVSWPTRGELYRASLVVIWVIIILAAVLFGYDLTWKAVFIFLKVSYQSG